MKFACIELVAVTKTRSPDSIPVAPIQEPIAVLEAATVVAAKPQTPETILVIAVPLLPTVIVPWVSILPLDAVVVARPPTIKLPDVDITVVETLARLERPVTVSVPPVLTFKSIVVTALTEAATKSTETRVEITTESIFFRAKLKMFILGYY